MAEPADVFTPPPDQDVNDSYNRMWWWFDVGFPQQVGQVAAYPQAVYDTLGGMIL